MGFPCGSAHIESACNAGDLGLIPGLGRSPGEGTGYPLQYSGLENSVDCTVHGVTKSRTRLTDFRFHWAWTVLVGDPELPSPQRWGSDEAENGGKWPRVPPRRQEQAAVESGGGDLKAGTEWTFELTLQE